MNNRGGGAPLTWVIIGLAAAIAVITLSVSFYTDFLNENGGVYDSSYSSAYNNLSKTSDLDGMKTNMSDTNYVTSIKQVFATTGNVFLIGLNAMQATLNLINFVPTFITTITSALKIPTVLVWFFILALTIYIAMKYIKGARGTAEEI